MARRAWQATVHGVAKSWLVTTEWLTHTHTHSESETPTCWGKTEHYFRDYSLKQVKQKTDMRIKHGNELLSTVKISPG